MIDVAALVSLRAVADHGSVVAAADVLGFTPSAVSQQVKRLERQVGVPLLERVGRGVVPTAAGRQLVVDGVALLADLERLEAGVHRRAAVVAGHLRLAAFSTAVRGVVAPALGDCLGRHPDLRVAMHEAEPWRTVDLVATGHTDVGVAHRWGDVPLEVPEHVETQVLLVDEADVVLRRDHPLAGRATLTPRDLLDVSWVATPEATICRQWLRRMYAGTGHAPRVIHVAADFDSHLALVLAGLGVALVPRLGRAALSSELVAVPVREPTPTREVLVVVRRSLTGSPAVEAVVAALVRVAGARP